MAGGPKCETELQVLEFVHDGMQKGAVGINLGRNVWQSPHPVAMAKALNAIVHENVSVKTANEILELALRDVLTGVADWKTVKKALASSAKAEDGLLQAIKEPKKSKDL